MRVLRVLSGGLGAPATPCTFQRGSASVPGEASGEGPARCSGPQRPRHVPALCSRGSPAGCQPQRPGRPPRGAPAGGREAGGPGPTAGSGVEDHRGRASEAAKKRRNNVVPVGATRPHPGRSPSTFTVLPPSPPHRHCRLLQSQDHPLARLQRHQPDPECRRIQTRFSRS